MMKRSKNFNALLQLGIWPGPKETEENFLLRAQKQLEIFKEARGGETIEYSDHLKKMLLSLFFIEPLQNLASYESKGLYPWEGAAMLCCEEDGVCYPKILLSPRFKKGKYLWYSRDEVLAHEFFHAARVMYQEPTFEELLAYQTSTSRLRQMLGPIFQNPLESILFLFFILLSFSASFCFMFFDYKLLLYVQYIPIVYMICLFLRLLYRMGQLKKTIRHISPFLKDRSLAYSVVARLTDDEISMLANAKRHDLKSFFVEKEGDDLRKKLLLRTFA